MKKVLIFSIIIFSTVGAVFAQKDSEAAAILKKVSEQYRLYDVIKSDFSFSVNSQQGDMHITESGTLVAKSKANKFKVTIYAPESTAAKQIIDQEMISDGKTQWTYLKKDNEVQVTNADNTGEGFNPAKIFTIYEHGYKYIYNGEKKMDGKTYQEIDLTPEDPDKQFFKVRLTIDKIKKQIYSALIFDKNGSHYNYTVRSFTGNPPVAETIFTFDPKEHKGVEVVDLK
jgi:outer membrane lipoprotein-sorting protein